VFKLFPRFFCVATSGPERDECLLHAVFTRRTHADRIEESVWETMHRTGKSLPFVDWVFSSVDRVLVLEREDVLEQFVSHRLSVATGEWRAAWSEAVVARTANATIEMELEDFRAYARGHTAYYAFIRDECTRRALSCLMLRTRDFGEAPRQVLARIADFLGLPPASAAVLDAVDDLHFVESMPFSEADEGARFYLGRFQRLVHDWRTPVRALLADEELFRFVPPIFRDALDEDVRK